MNDKKRTVIKIIECLKNEYDSPECSLDYDHAWQLMVSVRLAAQCKDSRVNEITKILFDKYPTPNDLAEASADDIEMIVRPCGLGKTKSKDIKASMEMLVREYDGKVPDTIDELLKFPGVGRKSANLIVGDIFGKPAIVCDTHCIRISNRLGLCSSKQPEIVEKQLREIVPPEEGNDLCHRFVMHGRAVCDSRNPKCSNCCISGYCDYNNELTKA